MNKKTKTKQTIVGKETYVVKGTGEVKEFKVIHEEMYMDYNFQKIWVKDLIKILKALGGTKVSVFCHILEKKNLDNIFIGSITDIAKKLKISVGSVKEALKIMKDLDCIRMIKNGVYQMSPNLIIKGKSAKRQALLFEYNNFK